MAGNTIRRSIGIIAVGVAFGAIGYVVSFGQGEKIVFNLIGRPVESGNIVAIRAIGGKARILVVGVGGGSEVRSMAIDAFVANPLEAQRRFRLVAIGTGGKGMCAEKRETVILMQLGNIIHQPVFGVVASGTIFTDCAVVHIGMAGYTLRFCIRKDHRCVAGPAVHLNVLSGEWETGFGMTESRRIPTDLPAGCL